MGPGKSDQCPLSSLSYCGASGLCESFPVMGVQAQLEKPAGTFAPEERTRW